MAGSRTALVADDDAASRRLLVRWLEQEGWRVVEASTGEQAHWLAQRHPVELVLLDLRMPGPVDGLKAASLLRQCRDFETVPIIAVSASPYREYRQRAFQAGCTAFLSKPVQLKELSRQVKRLTGEQG